MATSPWTPRSTWAGAARAAAGALTPVVTRAVAPAVGRTVGRTVRRTVGLTAAFVAAGAAWAHGGGVLDLEALEGLVAARADTAPAGTWRAYLALDRALDRPSRRGLVTDVEKVAAAAKSCRGALADDTELRALVDDAIVRADALLGGEIEDVERIDDLLERARDRAAVERLLRRAEASLLAARNSAAESQRLAGFRRAAVRFAAAETSAQRLVAKQARRAAPGQPVPKGPAGTIDVYAGSGAQGSGVEGSPARATPFYFPFDVAIDPASGAVLVVDSNTHRVRRIDADGRVRTAAGSGQLGDTTGPATQAKLHHPSSVAFDPSTGDMMICGWHAARVLRLVAATGAIEYAGGSGELAFSGDGGPALDAQFDYPSNVAFLSDGSWIVADAGNLRIRRVAKLTGTIDTIAGSGARGSAGDGGDALLAAFDFPPGEAEGPVGRIAVDPSERWVYVADTGNHRIRRIDLGTGEIEAFAGTGVGGWAGDDGPREAAAFQTPVDVDCDADGNVYVCDRGSSTVRRIDASSGLVTTIAGTGVAGNAGNGGPAVAAKLDAPQGIHVDRVRGRVYVADTFNSVVRVIWE